MNTFRAVVVESERKHIDWTRNTLKISGIYGHFHRVGAD